MQKSYKKKLIEVALPLEAINQASAREKSIRHGHPSTLHLWWARRPLAAARAVIFAQMVDDPSAHPDLFPTEEAQEQERQRLFRIIEELVKWENTNNEEVLRQAREEIWKSWRRTCAENADHPRAEELFNPDKLPAFHDPFAGGGSLPLEAQRLGLESYASDLNPVAVLINKAMIEIPPKFAGMPPVNPKSRQEMSLVPREWRGAQGLAEDVRYYGQWMRDEAERRVSYLYPKIEVTEKIVQERPDLLPYAGRKLTVIAWIWARTVKSPNPAFSHVDVPLVSSFILSTKPGREAYIEPVIENDGYTFKVRVGKPEDSKSTGNGTRLGTGANFRCLMSGTPITGDYIRAEGKAGRIGWRLMAIVAEGDKGRVYLPPPQEHEAIAQKAKPNWKPEVEFFKHALGFRVGNYGMTKWSDLFTNRQLMALTTLSDLIPEVRERIRLDALAAGLRDDTNSLNHGGNSAAAATAYADTVSTYLALSISKTADYNSTICGWISRGETLRNTFARQAVPMVWDFSEANPLGFSTGSWSSGLGQVARAVEMLRPSLLGYAFQSDAQSVSAYGRVVSTDPPYYDNIGYADLSDYFYVWLRRSLRAVYPDLFATLAVPKSEELVATPYRHGGREQAESFFLEGMTQAMRRLAEQAHPDFPITIYYAFKQSESDRDDGAVSTGWETFLDAVIQAGFSITGTWPIHTERGGRNRGIGSNALATSIVLVCRPRAADPTVATRRELMSALRRELPGALARLQRSNIAPVDLAQAAIGPGMAIYTRYSRVLDAEGMPLSVREALSLINQTLDEVLAEQEGAFDADTRWALAWYEQVGFNQGDFGVAETLSKAKNTSVSGMTAAGIVAASRGKVRLLRPTELPSDWDPTQDKRLTVWEIVHHLIRALEEGGEGEAAQLVAQLGSRAETARELAYRLYTVSERKKRATEALWYNSLVQSWPEIMRLARDGAKPRTAQATLFDGGEEE